MKKIFLFLFALAAFSVCIAEEVPENDWVLAAEKFTFPKNAKVSESELATAAMIPQLIMEQISTDGVRLIPELEKDERSLDSLLTERLSLFLELSKEIKCRDSLVLKNLGAGEFQRELQAHEKTVSGIQKKIDENLEKQKLVRFPEEKTKSGRKKKPSVTERIFENISVYKDDTSVLFERGTELDGYELSSKKFGDRMRTEKINGLITGSIVVYGQYAAVTAELFMFPGGKSIYSVTEVGPATDPVSIAKNIAFSLIPRIANGLPVELSFHIEPEGMADKCILTVDSVVYDPVPETMIVNTGVHTVSLEAEGFDRETFIYGFNESRKFNVEIKLQESDTGSLRFALKKFSNGEIFHDGISAGFASEPGWNDIPVKVNGNAVLGHFEGKLFVKKTFFEKWKERIELRRLINERRSAHSAAFSETEESVENEMVASDAEDSLENVKIVKTDGKPEKNDSDIDYDRLGFMLDGHFTDESVFFYIPSKLLTDGNEIEVDVRLTDVSRNIDKRRREMYVSYSALMLSLPFLFYSYGNYISLLHGYATLYGNVERQEAIKYQNMSFIAMGISISCGVWFGIELYRYLRTVDKVLPAYAKKASLKTKRKKYELKTEIQPALPEQVEQEDGAVGSDEIVR